MGGILGPKTLITVKEAEIGDLLLFSEYHARAIGIVLGFNDDREALVGMLEGYDLPRLRRLADNELCATFGSNWLIEPCGNFATGPDTFEVQRRAGLLVLTRSGWTMNFATSNLDSIGRFSWEWRDLASGSAIADVRKGLVFERWQVWTSEHDRNRVGAAPLLAHEAKPTPQQ